MSLVEKVRKISPSSGFGKLLKVVRLHKVLRRYRRYVIKKRLKSLVLLFDNLIGLEIGGGTKLFSKGELFPVYSIAKEIDGCNFSNKTVWEGDINSNFYVYDGVQLGVQFIGEAESVNLIVNRKYDFIISSNCLEHLANPLKALHNWLDVLNETGLIFLILPNKQSNFDHRRPDTEFAHLLDDLRKGVNESDMTHFDEIIKLHDLSRDPGCESSSFFLERSKKNKENRCFHHHIFTEKLLCEIFQYLNLEIIFSKESWDSIYIMGRKK